MSATPSPSPALAESIDARIARLKGELADAELQKLDDDMGEAAGPFLGVTQEGSDLAEIRTAVDFVRDAWARFELWRAAHRSESAEVAADGPRLALSPIVLLASPPFQDAAVAVAQVLAPVPAPGPKDRTRRTPTSKQRCSRCGDNGHRAPDCWSGQAAPQERHENAGAAGDAGAPAAGDDMPLDPAAMGDHPEVPSAPASFPPGSAAAAFLDTVQPPSPPAVAQPAKRQPGSGSVYGTGTGWRWSIRRAGMDALQGRTFPTEAEALADLDRVVAERAAGAATPDLISMAPAAPVGTLAKENACSVCGDRGHNARRHGRDAVSAGLSPQPQAATVAPCPAPSTPAPPPGPVTATPAPTTRFSIRVELNDNDRGGAARRRTNDRRRIEAASAAASPPAADAGEDEVAEEEDGEGWSPADADGRQTCLPCGGEGVDNRPGEGAGRCCLCCDGEGYRWPEGDTAPPVTPAAAPEPTSPAAPTPAAPPPPSAESHPDFLHPGRGWGPVDASGVAVHSLCNGTGKIRVKGVFRGCFPCERTGIRRCVPRSATAEGRMQ